MNFLGKLFNYKSDDFLVAIKQCRDSFIAIDNADCLINDDVRRYTNMRDSIENISQLQKKLNDLQLENQILRNMLDKAGLSYYKELSAFRKNDCKEAYDLEQGKRIIHPQTITENMANKFFYMFWGRQDVYAKRSVNKETGKAAYYPQCNNLWTSGCHRKLKDGINCKDCKNCSYKTITKFIILNHLQGNSYNATDVIGIYPLFSNGTCRFIVFDFDNHDKGAEERDFANTDDTWIEEVEAMREICVLNGIDGLEKINYMLIGSIRYSYTAKEKAKEQGIQHLVYPRFTRTVPPRGVITEKMHPNEAYEIIHNNDVRDEQIIGDVIDCVSAGRTPVVLSRYKDHSEKLYECLKSYADYVFLMTGNNSKKEHRKILEQMHQVNNDKTMILVATGSLVGEGFDFPRLDTLFMATPVSFRGVVEQYAGRLNRDYAGKENVIIYDYVDNHIPMFDNMYMKRLKAYKQIGYELSSGLKTDKQTANAIYDGDNYREIFHKDLFDANKNIIISSPAISGQKVYELINMLKKKEEAGVQITVVTWTPDSYGFGDAAYWMQLHEDMRKAGFYIKTEEEYCDRFAVIDQEVVWYGNINLLAKDKIDDSIMRVMSKDIACELMEITFGDSDGKGTEYNEN